MTVSLAVRALGYVPLRGSNYPLMDITRIAKGPKHWCTEERRSFSSASIALCSAKPPPSPTTNGCGVHYLQLNFA
jgi:hypothetical protein